MVEDESPAAQSDRLRTAAREKLEKELIVEQVPDQLRALMLADVIDSAMLRHAVHQRGCYPEDTPIASYDPQFITEALWPRGTNGGISSVTIPTYRFN